MTSIKSVEKKEPVDFVNPDIGGIGHLLKATMPVVSVPHGMMQASPVFNPDIYDRYLADKIYGIEFSGFTIMAASGIYNSGDEAYACCSTYDHDLETVSPYYYSVLLEDSNIGFEYSVSHRALYSRIAFNESSDSDIIIRLDEQSKIEMVDSSTVKCISKYNGINSYLYLELSKPVDSYRISSGKFSKGKDGKEAESGVCLILKFSTAANEYIHARVGLSYISCEQASMNLKKEISTWDFDIVRNNARCTWNNTLDKIKVKGGSEKERVIFYTALYRSLLRPCDISEYERYFSGYDGKVHETVECGFYVADGTWDSYRTQHPLQLLIEPERQNDIVKSFIQMYEQSGWLPRFPYHGGDLPVMIGNHGASFIADAYFKGFTGFDVSKALEAMEKTAKEITKLPWRNCPATELDKVYHEKGFFPALVRNQKEWVEEVHPFEKRQAVSVTLDHCYDDWCIAQLARELNRMELYHYFIKSAYNYRNLYNTETGFMSPKTADGEWVENFNPKLDGGQGGRDYFAECNSWIFTFHVQHDVQGLIELMGGKENFVKRLDSLFIEQYDGPKYDFLKQFPDATGLIGQFCQGNEPTSTYPICTIMQVRHGKPSAKSGRL